MEHVLKLVDDKLAVAHGGTSLLQEASQIVQRQVEMLTEGITAEVMEYVQQLVEGKLAVALCGISFNYKTSDMAKHKWIWRQETLHL
ncbi:unnamed protein product [Peronospora belbahrii]|uniref:Uncharacterized protein n=1 Tax=Peronospora belbahrii TaxID=622444 RepID=A0AAU9LHE4_9STRA|nr:unnamed protein product [Peronospora belbahrii]CAH0519099.1 unnamed protein product [Peronospora belbahrii]